MRRRVGPSRHRVEPQLEQDEGIGASAEPERVVERERSVIVGRRVDHGRGGTSVVHPGQRVVDELCSDTMALTRGIDRQALQVTDLAGDAGHRETDDRPFNGDRPGMGERRGVHDVGEGGAVVAPNGSEGADIDANSGIEVPSTQRPDALFPPPPAVLLERALEEREFVDATEPGNSAPVRIATAPSRRAVSIHDRTSASDGTIW